MMPQLVAFALAAAAALAGTAGYVWLAAEGRLVAPLDHVPIIYVAPPVLMLALFQIVFGAITGRWRGWRFWAVAVPFVALVWLLGLIAVLTANVHAGAALAAVLAAKVAFGLWALRATEPGGAR